METALARLLETPAVQSVLVASSAVVSEDAAAIASGALVTDARMGFQTACLGLFLGIAIGDALLFAAGRFARRLGLDGRLASPKVARAAAFFQRHGPWVILAARCLPGTRVPVYFAAGALRTRWLTFLATSIPAAAAWSFLLLLGLTRLGAVLGGLLSGVPWVVPVALAAAVLALVLLRRHARRRRQAPTIA